MIKLLIFYFFYMKCWFNFVFAVFVKGLVIRYIMLSFFERSYGLYFQSNMVNVGIQLGGEIDRDWGYVFLFFYIILIYYFWGKYYLSGFLNCIRYIVFFFNVWYYYGIYG